MSRKKTDGNLKFAAVFFVLVVGLIAVSLFFHGIIFLKDSKFDGSSHFTLEVKRDSGRKIQIISFSPKNSTIGILTLENVDPKVFEIPVDATVQSNLNFNKQNIRNNLFRTISDFKDQKEVNFIDIFRLSLFLGTVKDSAITEKYLNSQTEKVDVDSIVSTFFIDPQISDEKLNIEIINSTNEFGLGNKLANYVSNMGGNVILVSTGDEKKQSEINFVQSSYTVGKLRSILHFKAVQVQKKSLPDIVIIIGNDSIRDFKF